MLTNWFVEISAREYISKQAGGYCCVNHDQRLVVVVDRNVFIILPILSGY